MLGDPREDCLRDLFPFFVPGFSNTSSTRKNDHYENFLCNCYISCSINLSDRRLATSIAEICFLSGKAWCQIRTLSSSPSPQPYYCQIRRGEACSLKPCQDNSMGESYGAPGVCTLGMFTKVFVYVMCFLVL